MRALVIGGTGLVGGAARDGLLEAGHDVVSVSRGQRDMAGAPRLREVRADRGDAASLRAALGGERFDFTVDTLAYDGDDVTRLLEVPGFDPGRLVVISTGQVYLVGSGARPPFREGDAAAEPIAEPEPGSRAWHNWAYGMGKRRVETELRRQGEARGLRTLALRIPVVQGERDGVATRRLWGWLERVLDGGPVLLPERGLQLLRFVYAGDVGVALARLAALATWPREPALNLSSTDDVTLRAFVELLAQTADVRPRLVDVAAVDLAAERIAPDCAPYWGRWTSRLDPSKLLTLLGMTPTPLEVYLPRVVKAHLTAPRPTSHDGYATREREIALAARAADGGKGAAAPSTRAVTPASERADQAPGALVVWNPLFQPDTMLAHVAHWRASGAGDARFTWWGRIYDPTRPGKLPQPDLVKSLDEAIDACNRGLAEAGRVVLYATDFRTLHALEVDEVRRAIVEADGPGPDEAEIPTYYRSRRVIAWFRVRDVRALSFEALDTLQYLREHVKGGGGAFGYDPYASMGHRYPAHVTGPSARVVFDEARAQQGVHRFADLEATVYPPRLARARSEVEARLGAATWGGLDEASRLFLASARLVTTQAHRLDAQLELTPLVMYLSNTLEREVVRGVLKPLHAALQATDDALPARHELGEPWLSVHERQLTLGAAPRLLPAARAWAASFASTRALRDLTSPPWAQWLEAFSRHRNDAAHARQVDPRWAREAAAVIFGEKHDPVVGSPLAVAVAAKLELQRLLPSG